jgi:hypothetical protein
LRDGAHWGDNNTVVNKKLPPVKGGGVHCFDVAARNKSPGALLSDWQCCCKGDSWCGSCGDTVDNYNQIFAFNVTLGLLTDEVSKMGGLCVTAKEVIAGSQITMEPCLPDSSTQQWLYSDSAPHFQLKVSSNPPLCLDVGGATPHPTPTISQECFQNESLRALPYCNTTLDAKQRAVDLVQRLTLQEKYMQLTNKGEAVPRLGVLEYMYHSEGLHGLRTVCKDIPGLNATGFPQVTAMAATGNLSLIHGMGLIMSDEARAMNNIAGGRVFTKGGGLDYWGPTMNIGRDPRWGRFQESVSECPWLNGAYAAEFVKGMQGADDGVAPYTKIAACCKHFYAYSLENSDGFTRHNFNANVSERDLVETYLVPFRACAAAGVEQVMCSYNGKWLWPYIGIVTVSVCCCVRLCLCCECCVSMQCM